MDDPSRSSQNGFARVLSESFADAQRVDRSVPLLLG